MNVKKWNKNMRFFKLRQLFEHGNDYVFKLCKYVYTYLEIIFKCD